MAKYVSLEKLQEFLTLLKAKIPTKTSDLTNDSSFVEDANYVHTDMNYTAVDKAKLNGIAEGATKTTVDDNLNSTSENPVQNKVINEALGKKVDSVAGKGLSTEDFTTTLKNKLDGVEAGANNYTLPAATAAALGGVKIGANITIATDGTISVTALDWANINGKPTKLSEFTNDEGFITNAVADLANYYKKSETYTKTEVTTLIGDIKTITIQKVDTLPSTGQSNVIYLVPKTTTATSNIYTEYIWVAADSKFEAIGDTAIDLSNYWSKTDLVEVTSTEITNLFNNW